MGYYLDRMHLEIVKQSDANLPNLALQTYKAALSIDDNFNRNLSINLYRVPLHKNLAKERGRVDIYA